MTRRLKRFGLVTTLFAATAGGVRSSANPDVIAAGQAVLDRHCVKCHGPLEQKSGLELDTPEAALKGGREGPVITPGHPEKSLLLLALLPDAETHMPPKKQLAETDIAALQAWVGELGRRDATNLPTATPPALSLPGPVPAEPSAAIDYFLQAAWTRQGVRPAGPCDDLTFLRRAQLDLTGRIPTAAEVAEFLGDSGPDKRRRWLDRLLASDDYPRTFREVWDVLLMGRHSGRREQRRKDNGWFDFLEDAFRRNRPWNEVVYELIAARPPTPGGRGAAWFVFERKNDHQAMAEAVAPLIFGTRVDCAQCHDHPLAREIKQAHYWALVAAFNRSKNVDNGPSEVGESAIGGFINFTNLKKESQPARLVLLSGPVIDEARPAPDVKEDDAPTLYVDVAARAKVPKFSRRAELARAATEGNPLLARAFVNHTWAILFGRGIVHPVDELNSKHPPAHPELLDWLAADFRAHNYDIRRLVRAMVNSRAYQQASPAGVERPDPSMFAAAAEKPLLAETIARCLTVASGRTESDPTLRQALIETFPDVLPRVTRATIQQAMFLANNVQLEAAFRRATPTNGAPGPAAEPADQVVRGIFRRTLIREPDDAELDRAREYLLSHADAPESARAQLAWALVAGPEFLVNR